MTHPATPPPTPRPASARGAGGTPPGVCFTHRRAGAPPFVPRAGTVLVRLCATAGCQRPRHRARLTRAQYTRMRRWVTHADSAAAERTPWRFVVAVLRARVDKKE